MLSLPVMQANGTTFDTPEELLQRLGLLALTQQSFSTFLAETLGGDVGSRRYAEEFIASVNRVNYNQGNDINAFVGEPCSQPEVNVALYECGCVYPLNAWAVLTIAAQLRLQRPAILWCIYELCRQKGLYKDRKIIGYCACFC